MLINESDLYTWDWISASLYDRSRIPSPNEVYTVLGEDDNTTEVVVRVIVENVSPIDMGYCKYWRGKIVPTRENVSLNGRKLSLRYIMHFMRMGLKSSYTTVLPTIVYRVKFSNSVGDKIQYLCTRMAWILTTTTRC
jgi:hypothetical protein